MCLVHFANCIFYIIAGKHLHAASGTENVEENTFRHGLARRTKIFRVGQIFFNTTAVNFYPRIKISGRTFFLDSYSPPHEIHFPTPLQVVPYQLTESAMPLHGEA